VEGVRFWNVIFLFCVVASVVNTPYSRDSFMYRFGSKLEDAGSSSRRACGLVV
jgi:hypothetical protein